jgi:hypothetical protein
VASTCFSEGADETYVQYFCWGHLGTQLHGKLRRSWKDDMIISVKEVGCEDARWVELAQSHL